jgi:hypothetical protein
MSNLQRTTDSNPTCRQTSGARTVCDIADIGFTDAIEFRQIIQALEFQNRNEISEALLAVGAGYAAIIIRNALIARLVLLVGRVFDASCNEELHVSRAMDLMKDNAVRSEIETRGRKDLLAESKAAIPGSRRRSVSRRWRLPHERTGIRNRRAIRYSGDHGGTRQ